MQINDISYKTIPYGSGCMYVFGIWTGGIYACYRRLMYTSGTNTMIYKHKMYVEKSTGRRYIVFRTKKAGNKKMKAWYEDIRDAKWEHKSLVQAQADTGISAQSLNRVRLKVAVIAQSNRLNISPRTTSEKKHIMPSKKRTAKKHRGVHNGNNR